MLKIQLSKRARYHQFNCGRSAGVWLPASIPYHTILCFLVSFTYIYLAMEVLRIELSNSDLQLQAIVFCHCTPCSGKLVCFLFAVYDLEKQSLCRAIKHHNSI